MPKFTYPGTRYLGPGNPYPNGKPTSSADEIAQRHDKSYIDAKSNQDILDSDWVSTKEFASDFIKHPSIQSAVGAVGLGIKTGAERVIGVQYPDMKRAGDKVGGTELKKHQSQSITSTEQAEGESSEPMDDLPAEVNLAATGNMGGGAGGGVSRARHIFSPIPQTPEYMTRTFKKTYHFFSKNDLPRYTKISPQGANDILLEYTFIQAPPVDRLQLYCSPREQAWMREQFTEVNCEHVSCDIYSLGARGQFSTGGTTVTNANMQLQPYIAQFVDIDKHFPTVVAETDVLNFLGKLEGGNPYDVATASAPTTVIPTFPARSGSRSMSVPLTIVYPNPHSYASNTGTTLTSAVENKLNWPNLYEYAHIQNGAILAEGTPTFSYSYKPKNKFLFGRSAFTRHEAFEQASATNAPGTLMQTNAEYVMRTQQTQQTITGASGNTSADVGDFIMSRNEQPENVRIENQYQHNATEMFKPHRMPRFMFGVMPLRNQGEGTNQEIQWEFLMHCTITVRCKMGAPGMYGHTLNFPEPMYMFPTIQKGDFGNFGAISGGSTNTGTQITQILNRRNIFGRPTFTSGGTSTIQQGTGSTVDNIPPTRILRSRTRRTAETEKEKEK